MDAKEEVRERLAIEDVIGEYVQLKRAGRTWKGLSPFTSEKTPSFVVSPDKQIWHDFSSGRGGDIFSFIQEMEGVDFKTSLEILARRAGVDLDQYRQAGVRGQSSHKKERLYEVNELACTFYQTQFGRHKAALAYVLRQREFRKETALAWRLGYSPNTGRALLDFLLGKGFSEQEVQLAGLTSRAYRGGLQDMFRGRLMIPLCDPQGRVVGFTARLLTDDPHAPKYINTPGTPLYDKSRHVFGLHLAKEAIRKQSYVVLTEGNLDVISSHQAGVRQVVAAAGTALTEPNLKALSRLTGDIRLCFDADKAGVAATERAIPIAGKIGGIRLSVITIPSGKDPDELIRQDVAVWRQIIEQPMYALDWLIKRYTATLDVATALGKRELSDVVLRVVRQLPDKVEQDHYVGRLAELLHVSKEALATKLHETPHSVAPLRRRVAPVQQSPVEKVMSDKVKLEERLMALTLMKPSLRTVLYSLDPDMFSDDDARHAFEFLAEHPDFDGSDQDEVQQIAEYAKILSLVYETLYQDVEPLELRSEANRLQATLIHQYVRMQKQTLSKALQTATNEEATALLQQVRNLDQLLRTEQGDTSGTKKG
ncbi:DNA primase [Candidatus Saccharibacteria bacterium]|nr:MAG: DNA primase [Candidatus Saccharibacteria bacterium]PID98942.1 MAG: DNA primase [Candidatus Saccharibacteria bacterium]